MSSICSSCKQILLNNTIKKCCGSCQQIYCSNCVYQRIAVPKLNYQMYEVCTKCFHSISTELMLQKPPKNFLQRLEQQQQPSSKQIRMPVNQLDPETKALEERLEKLRMDFPAKPLNTTNNISNNPDDLIQQMHDELSIKQREDYSLQQRLRILHETMPAATPDTVILPSRKKSEEKSNDDNDDEEFPWCTICNDNARKHCLDCDELFCESCAKKIHRQSDYKNHQLEVYKPSAKAKKKYNY
ncbi:unnamed protein product [Rotaria sp. Silwood2]|nr:unnamed protein product [Rotaria sp. Silwood2]CAF3336387.1 unnamed protein product [Rotaria sp. Silwood2]CAF4413997.1 unnamed protein product [Rotaria sp. Silwood2]